MKNRWQSSFLMDAKLVNLKAQKLSIAAQLQAEDECGYWHENMVDFFVTVDGKQMNAGNNCFANQITEDILSDVLQFASLHSVAGQEIVIHVSGSISSSSSEQAYSEGRMDAFNMLWSLKIAKYFR